VLGDELGDVSLDPRLPSSRAEPDVVATHRR
jgi:hypothetical protein